MKLEQLLQGISISDRRGRLDCDITSIVSDSRRVAPGALFAAIRGQKVDGHRHIHDAARRGAAAILAEQWPEGLDSRLKTRPRVVLVPDSRRALALVAANFYGQPSRRLLVAGVTGTNGKTTVTYLLESMIKAASRRVGAIGTIEARYLDTRIPIENTTPDPVTLERILAEMVDRGVTHAVMEVSSHALHQHRVTGIHFKVVAFTNLTQEHLDYHKTLDEYFQAKKSLFSDVLRKSRARGRMAVVNIDDPRGAEIMEAWGGKSLGVSLEGKNEADIALIRAEYTLSETRALIRTPKGVWAIATPLIGAHNMTNVLVSIGMALAMGLSRARIERGLAALVRVPGRLDRVPNESQKHIFVDYAHTPDAITQVLKTLRPLVTGRLFIVFGCGGDRDTSKREPMGRAVAEGANAAILTSDNPRNEDPREIARAVEAGLVAGSWSHMADASAEPKDKTFFVELDRRQAIRHAIAWLRPDDVLVIAGKGHETHQIVGREKRSFDDRDEARRIMAGQPPAPPSIVLIPDEPAEVDDSQVVETTELTEAERIATKDVVATGSEAAAALESQASKDQAADDEEPEEVSPDEVIEAKAEDEMGVAASAMPARSEGEGPPGDPKT